jgi:hypothetical protein
VGSDLATSGPSTRLFLLKDEVLGWSLADEVPATVAFLEDEVLGWSPVDGTLSRKLTLLAEVALPDEAPGTLAISQALLHDDDVASTPRHEVNVLDMFLLVFSGVL